MKHGRLLRALSILLALAVLGYAGLMTAVFVSGYRAQGAGNADAIIVLGARVMPDGELSTTLLRRCEAAYEAYAAGRADTLILCGAQGADEPMTEAVAMRDDLRARGVPDHAMLLDETSVSTKTNIENAMALMAARGKTSALVVTSAYHLRRALWIARDAGLPAVGVAARDPDLWHNRIKARAREALAWVKYFIDR